MKIVLPLLLSLAAFTGATAEDRIKSEAIASEISVIGRSGSPLGTKIKVEGTAHLLGHVEAGDLMIPSFEVVVTKVNEKNVEGNQRYTLEYNDFCRGEPKLIERPKDGDKIQFFAYETGTMSGIPDHLRSYAPFKEGGDFRFVTHLVFLETINITKADPDATGQRR